MKAPLISICIPTYNGEAYIRECLDSCLRQTFSDFEIIVSDDGSGDRTLDIVRAYADLDSRLKVIRNEKNLGLVANWNCCLEAAKGRWIKFVFQDDYIREDCLDQFAKRINDSLQLIVCARNFLLPENAPSDLVRYYTHAVRTLENTSSHRAPFFSPELISRIAVENICLNFIGEPSLVLFKKTVIKEIGLFNSDLKQICDLEFFLRIASRYGLSYIPEKLCTFRIHQASTTNTNIDTKYFELHYIEPLLFSWFLLYDEGYRIFRGYLNFIQMSKLRLYFKWKCFRAYQASRKQGRSYILFTNDQHRFKEIYKYKNGGLLMRMIALVKK